MSTPCHDPLERTPRRRLERVLDGWKGTLLPHEVRVASDVYRELRVEFADAFAKGEKPFVSFGMLRVPVVEDRRAPAGHIYLLTQPVEQYEAPAWDPSHREIL